MVLVATCCKDVIKSHHWGECVAESTGDSEKKDKLNQNTDFKK